MGRTFMPKIRTERELKRIQLEGLQKTINHVYKNSEFYQKRLDEAGVKPSHIKTLKDISKLPFTTAKDLQEGYPFPLRSISFEKIVRMHASSGTTGKRKVLCYTQKDINDWGNMFARCYEMAGLTTKDRVQVAVGYGVWTAGVGFQLGVERLGAMAVPIGPGNIDMQCQFLEDFQSTVLCATASMALLMGEEVEKRGLKGKIALKKVIMGSERSSDAMRTKMKELLGVDHVFDITGLTELYGPGTGIDCIYHEGIHYWADYYILELLNPETLQPVQPGETGEMVVTTLRKEAAPLIRYRTRDLTRLIPKRCSCGSVLPMHDRLLGRSDDMFIIRAVNIYPGQIDYILSNTKGVGSEYQIHLTRKEDGKDYMTVKVERWEGGDPAGDISLASTIEEEIKKQILVSGKVEIVNYGSLPRSERKSKRVFDHREE
ncbi:MAG: phenylacetate--CoA ligase [Deltaproteobacteria bacterium]|nr:phenylacetate--CoA ligase [Deltaproteobacteria bacterium]MBM4348237.1 phenylacetate--CoA ligase [Deltaproteobacteria bacterium]